MWPICDTPPEGPACPSRTPLPASSARSCSCSPPSSERPPRPSPTPPRRPPRPAGPTGSIEVTPREGQDAKERLDARSDRVPATVTAWYVDPATRQTVVAVVGPVTPEATEFAADENPAAVRLRPMSAPVRPLQVVAPPQAPTTLVGGTAITAESVRCSVGWSVRSATTLSVLTAGHCTEDAMTWDGPDRRPLGTVTRSRYPTEDYGLIQVGDPSAWRPSGQVAGGPTVTGSTPSGIGAPVCRSGSTSGYHCGEIQGLDATVNYGSGVVVSGLVRTSACAEPGDSGGPFVDPGTAQAQGTLSGGSGDCTSGGESYFEPLAPLLERFGLTLVTGS
ncbi:S1 family peptidase [Actinomycetospora atypica]|uniref:S1 family peptidase n=1 Tax=Actinomycetospora atypica TaxID=1290095 RepID=A0ABV9YQZ0_9PSEU